MKNKIQQRFSRSAPRYDFLTSLHRSIADTLFEKIIQRPAPGSVLDVGCGTGYLTGKLKDHWPQSRVVGLDFSEGMLDVARGRNPQVDWVLGNGCDTPFDNGSFDLVVSNLAYQWADELPLAFREAHRLLVGGGVLSCTLFGYNTARELFHSLQQAKHEGVVYDRLPAEDEVRQALMAGGLKGVHINAYCEQHEFKDMFELIKWFKSIGVNNLKRQGFLGPETLARAADVYRKEFKFEDGVGATFEVIRVYAEK